MPDLWAGIYCHQGEGIMAMGGPRQYESSPIPIWTPFWKGFFELWKDVLTGLPLFLRFWDWEWEAIGYLVGVILIVGMAMAGLVSLGVWMFP